MYIFRASMKLKDGTIIYAKDYGKKAFRIPIGSVNNDNKKLNKNLNKKAN